MRSKTILSVVAFIAAFGISAAFAKMFVTETQTEYVFTPVYNSQPTSCFLRKNAAAADKIASLIASDYLNGNESGKAAYDYQATEVIWSDKASFSSYANAIEQYADMSGSLRANDLPSDFQIEWREHMKAWSDYSDFLNRMKKSANSTALTGEELQQLEAFHSREIKRTWKEVLQSGRSYGANVE